MHGCITRGLLGAATTALVLGTTTPAHAGCESTVANSCVNADMFWPKAGPTRFAFVGGSEMTARDQIAFGLITSYASRPIVLLTASPGGLGSTQTAVDNMVTSTFAFAYGVTERLSLDALLPVTFFQDGTGTSPITGGGPLPTTAMRDVRFGASYAIAMRDRVAPRTAMKYDGLGVAARFYASGPTGDSAGFARDRTAVLAPSISIDARFGRLLVAAEASARVRPATSLLGSRIGTQVGGSVGASFDLLPRELLTLQGEAYAFYNMPAQRTLLVTSASISELEGTGHLVPAEWSASLRSAPFLGGDMAFTAGGGAAIPFESATLLAPRFRFILGLSYAPLGRDSDHDHVPDRNDKCPNDPQIKSYPPRDGCTHLAPPDAPQP